MPGQVDAVDQINEAREYYAGELARGVDRYFLPALTRCPWCGAAELAHRTTTRDLRQFKPGRFRLDECRSCGHVFQNPPLDDAGLAFYYRDTYDGLAAERIEANLGSARALYRRRAETVRSGRPDTPRRWLDVGTASGHFPQTAAEIFPDTEFEGLDMSDGVLAAQAAGRVAVAHQGQFPDVSRELAGRFDQVSMIHYLEHTRDPLAELDAAARVLEDGGWLFVEQPDPDARSARIFRSWWAGWNQPEHLNMVRLPNLLAALDARGFEVVTVTRREAHVPLEAFIAVMTVLNRIAPAGDVPWQQGRPPRRPRLRRLIGKAVAAPLLLLANVVDLVVLPRLLHSYHAYRVLARKRPATD